MAVGLGTEGNGMEWVRELYQDIGRF